MTTMAVPTITYSDYRSAHEASLRRSRMKWFGLMLVSGAAATGVGFTGLILGAAAWIKQSPTESSIGAVLLAAAFPLFFLMAHCMDRIGEIAKDIRLEYCRRHGLKDEECE